MNRNLIIGAALLCAMPALSFAQASASASAAPASAAAKADSAAPAAPAHASCDDLKQKIASQIEGHGVKQYSLDVVDAAAAGDGKVVGHCDGGAKVLVYGKGGAAKADAKADAGK